MRVEQQGRRARETPFPRPEVRNAFHRHGPPVRPAEARARVETALNEELARFVRDGITQAELDTAKRAMKAQSDTWRSEDPAVAGAIADHLERGRQFKWNAELDARSEALTLAQVNAAIKRWIDPAKANWSWAGDFDKAPAK